MSASPSIRLPKGVTCFIHSRDAGKVVKHDSVDQVRECHEREHYNDYLAGIDDWDGALQAELAYERHLEDRGRDEAELDRRMEDARGVIQFEDAYAAALAGLTP